MRDPNNPCLFCNTSKEEFIFENKLAFVAFDSYPVSKFHSLIVPKRHVPNYFDLTNDELLACHDLLSKIKLDGIRDLDNLIIKRINPEKNATEQIRQYVYAFLDWCVQNINIAELIFEKLPNLSGEKSIIYRDYYRPFFRVVDILKKGVQRGEFNLKNEKLFTSLGFAWIYGIVRMHLHDVFIPEHRNNLDKLTDSMLDFILQGIKNKEHINE